MPFEIFTKKENPSEAELEMEEIYELSDRRKLLQQRWQELYEQEEKLQFKYPPEVKYDENKRFKGDRSFLTPEDIGKFREAEEGMQSITRECNELDKEILKMRFEKGLIHLKEVLKRDDVQWRQVEDHKPDPKNPDILYVKKWLAKVGDDIAEVEFSGEKASSFTKGVQEVAKEIGDTEVLQRLKKWPKEREIPYQGFHLRFLYGPKKRKRDDEYFRPGLTLSKRYDSHDEKHDITEVHLPLSLGTRAFPEISEAETARAKETLIQLGKKLEIEDL